ncbi:HpcH/HpaI aldolase/citrate lyase family protein [Roseococcus sp. YIM B11640]|uniref:HpcH/HpaI aldolase/citrate lyase family protein n=1 Tax=Roseococcus sp. YIM B11640 TaxID=3133973 RepID=UPI003C7BB2D8
MSCKLLITGGQEAVFAPAFAARPASVCLDLEDTVPDELKDATRALAPGFIAGARAAGCSPALRLSPLGTLDGLRDVLFLQELPELPDSVVLTKLGSRAELKLYEELLQGRCAGIRLTAIIESAEGLNAVEEIATSSARLDALSFGGKDFSKQMRMKREWEPLFHARMRVAHAAAMAGIGIYDEPYHPRDDLEGLHAHCLRVKAMGFTGKSATDPRHVPVIDAAFAEA